MDKLVYKRAESFLPWNLHHNIFNTNIFPYWAEDALYYFQCSIDKKVLIRIALDSGKKEIILDFQDIIKALSSQLNQEIDIQKLPFNKFYIKENPWQLCFSHENDNWCYDLAKRICIKQSEIKSEYLKSPDDKWMLTIKDHNLLLTDLLEEKALSLTNDGVQYYDYSSSPETNTRAVTERLTGIKSPPVALWSPDSRKIVTHKLDQRKVKDLFLLQNAPKEHQRPKLHPYKMSFAGDDHLPMAELLVIDVLSQNIIKLKTEPLSCPYLTPLEFNWVWWNKDGNKVYFIRETRGAKELKLCVADTKNGLTQVLINETAETYVEPSALAPWPHQVIILEEKKQIIWLSQRSGYWHLYLYDMENDNHKHAITNGDWCVREVHFYDGESDWLYFTGCGFDKTIDPYYKQLYRCHLDGSEFQCLTQESAHHFVSISPSKNFFLDTYSTIDTAPITHLKKMNGELICPVEFANIKGLDELNWIPPKRFCLKARDSKTSLYGNLYFPSTFDEGRKYPLIDHIYPGPQIYRTSQYFNLYGAIFRSTWAAQALAELGFIVMHLDGMGTPGRSKHFHQATYGNMGDCSLPDHIEGIKQLADQYSFIDLERIGITGYSGGGYAAARAILMYPDFYKVAVAAAGNHDLRCYPASYGEKYNSLDTKNYSEQSNAMFAERLQGKLLLIHGEMDDNVHPCATMQLVDALIKYNKDFDMLIMPNQNHKTTFDHPYYIRKQWDYFVQHLLGKIPPKNYLIKAMPSEFPQLIDW